MPEYYQTRINALQAQLDAQSLIITMAEVPFPSGAKDGTVFFHEDKVCIYSESLNTWECRKVVDPDDPNRPDNVIYTNDVYVPDYQSSDITYM